MPNKDVDMVLTLILVVSKAKPSDCKSGGGVEPGLAQIRHAHERNLQNVPMRDTCNGYIEENHPRLEMKG